MKLIPRNAPHIRHSDNNKTVMGDMIISLLPLYFIAFCYYGARVLVLMALSLVVCFVADTAGDLLSGRRYNFRDFSPFVTGLIIPLLMPVTASLRMVVVAGLAAILIAKQPFGGTGDNFFNPAAVGIAFATACWPTEMFLYPNPFDNIPLWNVSTVATSAGGAFSLKLGGIPSVSLQDMFLGVIQGPMGTTSVLVILACFLYLAFRRTIRPQLTLSFLASAALFAFLFPRTNAAPLEGVLYEMMSGTMVFAAVFMITDPVTSPKRPLACVAYGLAAGIVTMCFRHMGGFEQAGPFAILLMNALAPLFDEGVWRLERRLTRHQEGGEPDEAYAD